MKLCGKAPKNSFVRLSVTLSYPADYLFYNSLDLQKPKIEPQSNGTLVVKTNGTLILRCSSEANPKANVKWLKNYQHLVSSVRLYMKKNVESDDEGIYECTAENDVPLTKWSSVKVNVVGKRLHV